MPTFQYWYEIETGMKVQSRKYYIGHGKTVSVNIFMGKPTVVEKHNIFKTL